MSEITPQLAAVFAVTTAIGYTMLFAGVQKSMLEWRRQRRSCPACGRRIERRTCEACTAAC